MENTYTINLGKAWKKIREKRRKGALDIIYDFIKRHMKAKEVNISAEINHIIFSELPRKVKVKAKKEGEIAFVTLSTAEFAEKKLPKKEEKEKEEEEEKTPEEIEKEKKEKEAREVQDKAAVLEG